MRNRVESLSKRLLDVKKMSYAQRYRYNTLVAKYSAHRDLWRRLQQAKEEGLTAEAMASARLARWRGTAPSISEEVEGKDAPALTEEGQEYTHPRAPASARKEPSFVEVQLSDPRGEQDKVRKLYEFLLQAQIKLGEKKAITFENFTSLVQAKANKLKETVGCEAVTFNISIDDGKIKFVAKVAEPKTDS